MKVIRNLLGGIIILMAVSLLFDNEFKDYSVLLIFFLWVVLTLPLFDTLTMKIGRKLGFLKKLGLGCATFFTSVVIGVIFSQFETTIVFELIAVSLVWALIILTSKKLSLNEDEALPSDKKQRKNAVSSFFQKLKEDQIESERLENEKNDLIKDEFINLEFLSMKIISRMLAENKSRYNTCNNVYKSLTEVGMQEVIFQFSKSTFALERFNDLNSVFSSRFYDSTIRRQLKQLRNLIKNLFIFSLDKEKRKEEEILFKNYLNFVIDIVPILAEEKLGNSLLHSTSSTKLDYMEEKFSSVNLKYKHLLIYLADILATSTCVAQLLFINRKIRQIDQKSDFYKIISNMTNEISNNSLILAKVKPIYYQFHASEFGYTSNDMLVEIGILQMIDNIKNNRSSIKIEKNEIANANFKAELQSLIEKIAFENINTDIEDDIIVKIITSFKHYESLLFNLGFVNNWVAYYNERRDYHKKALTKNRYLNGDFSIEKYEQGSEYNLNNILTGEQFEMYLQNLFTELGYKVKHNGKTGDQGSDLLLKKGDYIYSVQAKFYSSPLGNTPVQEIIGSLRFYNANQGVVITNSTFTKGAENLAKANGVILIDGKDLKVLIDFIFDKKQDEDVLKRFIK